MTVPPAILMTVPLAVPLTAPMTATLDRPLTAVLSQYPYRTTRAPDSTSAPCRPGAAATCEAAAVWFSEVCAPPRRDGARRKCARQRLLRCRRVAAGAVANATQPPLQRCSVATQTHCARDALRCTAAAVGAVCTRLLGLSPARCAYTLRRSRAQRCALKARGSKRATATPDALGARGYSREGSAQSTHEYSHGARCTRRVGYVLASA